jgi:hypothetical protein
VAGISRSKTELATSAVGITLIYGAFGLLWVAIEMSTRTYSRRIDVYAVTRIASALFKSDNSLRKERMDIQ